MPHDAHWVMGQIQYETVSHVIQITPPDLVRTWLAEWRAGKHNRYD